MKYISALLIGFAIVIALNIAMVSVKMDIFYYLIGTSTIDVNSNAYWILAFHDLIIISAISLLGIVCYKMIFKSSPFDFKASLVMQAPLLTAALLLNGIPNNFSTTYAMQTSIVTIIACFTIVLIFNSYRKILNPTSLVNL